MTEGRERLRASDAVHTEREQALAERFGGFDWWPDFIGWAVAIFFTLLFAGIAAAIVGSVGYQIGAPVSGSDPTAQQLGIGGLIGGLLAVFLGYLVGGYTAGRMARFDGVKNGIGVVIWTVIMAVVLGVLGAVLGNRFDLTERLRLDIDRQTLTTAGVLSLAVTLVVMLLGAMLGGKLGAGYHRKVDRDLLPDYTGAAVVDVAGEPVGTVARSYVDEAGAPRLVSVKLGKRFAKQRLVPVDVATLQDDTLSIPYTRQMVLAAPDVTAQDTLEGEPLARVRAYYGGAQERAYPQGREALGTEDIAGGRERDVERRVDDHRRS